jgi:hypothetical protein
MECCSTSRALCLMRFGDWAFARIVAVSASICAWVRAIAVTNRLWASQRKNGSMGYGSILPLCWLGSRRLITPPRRPCIGCYVGSCSGSGGSFGFCRKSSVSESGLVTAAGSGICGLGLPPGDVGAGSLVLGSGGLGFGSVMRLLLRSTLLMNQTADGGECQTPMCELTISGTQVAKNLPLVVSAPPPCVFWFHSGRSRSSLVTIPQPSQNKILPFSLLKTLVNLTI